MFVAFKPKILNESTSIKQRGVLLGDSFVVLDLAAGLAMKNTPAYYYRKQSFAALGRDNIFQPSFDGLLVLFIAQSVFMNPSEKLFFLLCHSCSEQIS